MKRNLIFILIVVMLPFCSLAQMMNRHEKTSIYSMNDISNQSSLTMGKKKKKASNKETDTKKTSSKKQSQEGALNWNFYAGPDFSFGFPVGKIRDTVDNGMGFNLRAEYFLTPNLNLGIWTGYKAYKYDQVMVGEGHLSYVPVKLTGTYYFSDSRFRPYANLGLGMYLVQQKYDAEFYTLVQNPTTHRLDTLLEQKHLNEKQTNFGWSPSVGILYNVMDQYYINLNVGYEMILTEKKSTNLLGINLGFFYKFGF